MRLICKLVSKFCPFFDSFASQIVDSQQIRIEELEEENEILKAKIKELEYVPF
jgi:cell division protein FtsB